MAFGVYFHIPHCLQRCHYCDFATLDLKHSVDPTVYAQLLIKELRAKSSFVTPREISTIYFGGGTPSLIPTKELRNILNELTKLGFQIPSSAEITIEINPGTIKTESLDEYLDIGINRFSLGVQTFSESRLSSLGREHTVLDTKKDLELLNSRNINFTCDLLFATSKQSIKDLEADIIELLEFQPPHISCYLLTVPEHHSQNQHRAPEQEQADMFHLIRKNLLSANYDHYEISNYARKGFESQHNLLYWSNQTYWGLGMSAHSYFKEQGPYGTRSWNSPSIALYQKQIENPLPENQIERLELHEALTDFCHTHLRRSYGLSLEDIFENFGASPREMVQNRIFEASEKGYVSEQNNRLSLTPKGQILANQALLDFTFLASDCK